MENEFLEGRHALEEALAAGVPLRCVYVSRAAKNDAKLSDTLSRARSSQRVSVRQVDQPFLDAHSSHGAHQGVVAELAPYEYVGVEDLVEVSRGRENALVLACDHITDAGNFGAMLRSAEVAGAVGALIPNRRQAQVNTAVYKTSAGAALHLPIALEANLATSLNRLKEEGFWVVGASEHARDVAWDASLSGRIVLVMGSEEKGLAELTQKTCDLLVRLPQAGKVESLNVAQATTALCYEWMRQCSVTEF